jgi:hypothetical protein
MHSQAELARDFVRLATTTRSTSLPLRIADWAAGGEPAIRRRCTCSDGYDRPEARRTTRGPLFDLASRLQTPRGAEDRSRVVPGGDYADAKAGVNEHPGRGILELTTPGRRLVALAVNTAASGPRHSGGLRCLRCGLHELSKLVSARPDDRAEQFCRVMPALWGRTSRGSARRWCGRGCTRRVVRRR